MGKGGEKKAKQSLKVAEQTAANRRPGRNNSLGAFRARAVGNVKLRPPRATTKVNNLEKLSPAPAGFIAFGAERWPAAVPRVLRSQTSPFLPAHRHHSPLEQGFFSLFPASSSSHFQTCRAARASRVRAAADENRGTAGTRTHSRTVTHHRPTAPRFPHRDTRSWRRKAWERACCVFELT